MMFAAEKLRVALATVHIPLMDVRNRFTIGCVFQPIDLMHQALTEWFGFAKPRIGVCGLNPHASDEGRFGDEEDRIIKPAITMANDAGIDAQGPFPADTLFLQALDGKFDGVVAMYHDQGLIPVKLLAFDSSVNLTLGLPLIRTSVDHGTAFDIVGQNKANPGSMKAALKLACDIVNAQNRKAPAQRKLTWS
jgi:4-phospho-D-threonate 3-dehydrogenase / 4-phospho-D-erythronate 3-dehydrogenase